MPNCITLKQADQKVYFYNLVNLCDDKIKPHANQTTFMSDKNLSHMFCGIQLCFI